MKHCITFLLISFSVLTTGAQTSIQNPAPGEWPNFKRDIRHTGTVLKSEMKGSINKENHYTKWAVPIDTEDVEHFTGPAIVQLSDGFYYVIAASGKPGKVKCINGSTGAVLWAMTVPDSNLSGHPDDIRPLGLLAEDIDGDHLKELLVTTKNSNHVYCIRLEDENSIDTAGSIQWSFTFPTTNEISEGTPTAVNLDSDSALEVIVGTQYNGQGGARMYSIDGATGEINGAPFIGAQRYLLDQGCMPVNKMDSGCPAVSFINGQPVIYIGGWDGYFYALEWRTSPVEGLYAKWIDSLPVNEEFHCPIPKVRSSAAIGQIIPGGDEELVYGFMYEGPNEFNSYLVTPQLRILNAHGLGVIQTLPDIRDWKSTPCLADVDASQPGLEIEGGSTWGIYKIDQSGSPFSGITDTIPTSMPGGFRSSPAIADIDNDDEYELIIGNELPGDSTGLIVFDARTLTPEWSWFDTTENHLYQGVVSAPAVGDIDNDGFLEIVFLATDGILYAIDNNSLLETDDAYTKPILIYPNPSSGTFTVSLSELPAISDAILKIFNATGSSVYEQTMHNMNETIISNFSPGLYFVTLHDGEIMYAQILIIQSN